MFGEFKVETGLIFMVPVEHRNRETLLPVLKDRITPGTKVMSICWEAHDCLEDEGYKQLTVNHKIVFVFGHTGAATNHLEACWDHAKDSLWKKEQKEENPCQLLGEIFIPQQTPQAENGSFSHFLQNCR